MSNRRVGRYPSWMKDFSLELKNDVMLRMANGSSYAEQVVIAEQSIVEEYLGDFELMVDSPGLSAVTPTALGLSLHLNGGQDLGIENRLLVSYESADEVVSLTYDDVGTGGNRFIVTRTLFANVGRYSASAELEIVEGIALNSDASWESDGVWMLDATDVFEAKCSLVGCVNALTEGRLLGGYARMVEESESNQLSLFETIEDAVDARDGEIEDLETFLDELVDLDEIAFYDHFVQELTGGVTTGTDVTDAALRDTELKDGDEKDE